MNTGDVTIKGIYTKQYELSLSQRGSRYAVVLMNLDEILSESVWVDLGTALKIFDIKYEHMELL